jgi:predicted ATPase
MDLERISIEGFKSIRELKDFELRPLNVLIGANGSGKSNFIALFRLLNQMVEGRFQHAVTAAGGAETFLYFGRKITRSIRVRLSFPPNSYECVWAPSADDILFFEEETCYYQGAGYEAPYVSSLGSGHKESKLPGLANAPGRKSVATYVYESLEGWRVYHFHDTSDSARVKARGDINDNLYLRPDASNLGAFLFKLKKRYSRHYELIRDTVREVAPFFDDFLLRPDPTNEDKIRLEWRERASDHPFLAHHLSDGTLRFICLATLLLQPVLPSTILIDEPELGLHPYATNVLAGLLRSTARRTQIIVSTQSVPLVNQFEPEDLVVVERQEGASVFRRLTPEQTRDWLDDYGLGDLWEKNLLGGRP